MTKDDEPKPVYLDLVRLINNEVGEKIVELLAETGSPYHAIATIGAVIASIVTSIVDQEDKAMSNIDTITNFSKELAQSIIEKNKNDPDSDEIEYEDDESETLH